MLTTRTTWSASGSGASLAAVSTLKSQERFSLDAPPALVWDHLVDPARTVDCLPGAEITGQEDERTYLGAMKVKVGAVTVSYRGKLTFEEIDADRRYVRMVGKGREKTGSGSVTMTMEGRVLVLDDGGSEVTVDSEVRLTGKIVRFGRGMIESISAEVFKEFRVRLAAKLSQEGQGNTADAADGMAGGDGSAAGADGGRADGGASTGAAPADRDDTLNLLPLLLRAFRSWVLRLFGRR